MIRYIGILFIAFFTASCTSSSFYSGKAEDGVYSTVYAPSYDESTGQPAQEAQPVDPYSGQNDYVTSPYSEYQSPYQQNYNYNYWDRLYFNLGPYYNPYSYYPSYGGGFMNPYDPFMSPGWNTGLGWNSWNGWQMSMGYGMGYGMSPWGMNSWGMNPWGMSPYGWNSWGNPYWNPYWSPGYPGFNNWGSWNNGFGFADGFNNSFRYGPRTSMTADGQSRPGSLVRNRIVDDVPPPYLDPKTPPTYRQRNPGNPQVNTPSNPRERNPQPNTENERGSFWNSFIPGQNSTERRERQPNTNPGSPEYNTPGNQQRERNPGYTPPSNNTPRQRTPSYTPPSNNTPRQRTPSYTPPSNNTPRQRTPSYSPPSNNTPRQRGGGGGTFQRRP